MKQLKPAYSLALISALVALLAFCLDVIQLKFELDPLSSALLLAITLGGFTFISLYFGIRIFLQKRLNKMLKKLHNPPLIKGNRLNNMIDEAEQQVNTVANHRIEEIIQLKSQDSFRKEFIGNLAHELKTPVFAIQGYLDTLIDGAIDDPEIAMKFLERASRASDRMTQLLEDLDAITRLENPELSIEKRPFDIVEVIKEIYESLEFLAKEKRIELSLKKEYSSIYVMGDRNKIGQVFTNLVKNSILYGNEGGKTMITLDLIDKLILIEITDNGIGIDPKHWPRLFERFYRVEKSRNRHEGGTGLGLSIVKHILELHGQNITMQSTVGVGTTFSFGLEKSSKNVQLSSRGVPIR
jgi:two-component system, OmpR family, phosphate regulon sensor histidine kinase PhoR